LALITSVYFSVGGFCLHNASTSNIFSGFSNNCSFALPRLVSSADDVYLKVEMNGRDEEVTLDDSECLVGRFCPYPKRSDLLALADEDGYVIIQDTTKTGKESIVSCKYHFTFFF
jgi:hypothetical protein